MPNRKTKIAIIAFIAIACFYALQYVGTVVHRACQDPAEDCPPPIYGAGELLYRVLVEPPWLATTGDPWYY